jgi:2-keto-3-deoxy-L-fuconate dehydrogenase
MRRLDSVRILVTAAAAGIGRACAQAFDREGAIVLATDIDTVGLSGLRASSPDIETRELDVTSEGQIQELARDRQDIDVLVNVAGWVHHGSILDCTREAWDRSLLLNLTSVFLMSQAFLPAMCARGRGNILNISSVASSVIGVPNRFAYGASKAGIIGLTRSIAADHAAHGIRCNVICPGTVDTPSLQARLGAQGDYDNALKSFASRQPMGRLGRPEEVAALAVHLASDESAFTTGAVHVIDGGWSNI